MNTLTPQQMAEVQRIAEQAATRAAAAAVEAFRAQMADDETLDKFDTGDPRRLPYFQDIQRGGGGGLDSSYEYVDEGEETHEITYNPQPVPPAEGPTPDDPEPYNDDTEPPGGYKMQPREVWVERQALAEDVAADATLTLGEWLRSKRLVMCSQELEYVKVAWKVEVSQDMRYDATTHQIQQRRVDVLSDVAVVPSAIDWDEVHQAVPHPEA